MIIIDERDAVNFVVQMRQQNDWLAKYLEKLKNKIQMRQQNDLGELHYKPFSHVRYERIEFRVQITTFYNMADLHLTNVCEGRFAESIFSIHGGQSIDVVVGHFVKCWLIDVLLNLTVLLSASLCYYLTFENDKFHAIA